MASPPSEISSLRRSLSDDSGFKVLAVLDRDNREVLPPSDAEDHALSLSMQRGDESPAMLEQRCKSECFLRTAHGTVLQDTKWQQYQANLESLVQLAANASSSTQRNVLLAKKALRYRKVLERRRNYSVGNP